MEIAVIGLRQSLIAIQVLANRRQLKDIEPPSSRAEALSDLFDCPVSPAAVERSGRLFSEKLVRSEQRLKAAIRDSPVVGAGYISTARKQGHHLLYALERVLAGKPLTFDRASDAA